MRRFDSGPRLVLRSDGSMRLWDTPTGWANLGEKVSRREETDRRAYHFDSFGADWVVIWVELNPTMAPQ
jgi:hypothetical protein